MRWRDQSEPVIHLYTPEQSDYFFHKTNLILKSREQRLILFEVLLIDDFSERAMLKSFDLKTGGINPVKVKFNRNVRFLDVTINSSEQLIFSKNESLGC